MTDKPTPGSAAPKLRCPVHDMPDCSPLLNGCVLVLRLDPVDRELVDGAIEGVAETYKPEGVAIWWAHWLEQDEAEQLRLIRAVEGYGGMVTT